MSKRCRCQAAMQLIRGEWKCPFGCAPPGKQDRRRHHVGNKIKATELLNREQARAAEQKIFGPPPKKPLTVRNWIRASHRRPK